MKKLEELLKKSNSEGTFLGGSFARGFNDSLSDHDYGVIIENDLTRDLLIKHISKAFEEPNDVIAKYYSHAYHFKNNFNFEIRFVKLGQINSVVEKMNSGAILPSHDQELLFNLQYGKFITITPKLKKILSTITYSDDLKHEIITKFLPLLYFNELKTPVLRNDSYHLMKEIIKIKELVMTLGTAQKKIFLSSFKHEKKLLSYLSPSVTLIYQSLKDVYTQPSIKTFNSLDEKIKNYICELQNELI